MADKASTVVEFKMKAIKEFKTSGKFKAEVIKCSITAYGFGFDTCKAQLAYFFFGDRHQLTQSLFDDQRG